MRESEVTVFDALLFAFLSFLTMGGICATQSYMIVTIHVLNMTELDREIMVGLIISQCVSVVLWVWTFYIMCCGLAYWRLVLAIVYTIFDLVFLGLTIAIFGLRPLVLKYIGQMWTDKGQSAIVIYLEEALNCCGFNDLPGHDCGLRTASCHDAIASWLTTNDGTIGGISGGVFIVLLCGVVLGYVRALK